jgi:hypothetical protein
MNVPHGALRLIEQASVHLTEELGGLAAAVEQRLGSGDDDALRQAAHALAARLRLRAAAVTPSEGALPVQRVVDLARGLPAHVRLDHGALDPAACFAAAFGRVLLNAILLAAEGLQQGGVIRLAGGTHDVFVQIEGPDAAWPAGTTACAVDAAQAQRALLAWQAPQMALTTVLAHETGVRLSVLLAPNSAMQVPILRIGGG